MSSFPDRTSRATIFSVLAGRRAHFGWISLGFRDHARTSRPAAPAGVPMLLAILFAVFATFGMGRVVFAAEPATFAIITNKANAVPRIELKGAVRARIDGDTLIDPGKAQLRIDGELLNVEPRIPADRELEFPMIRNDKNRPLWTRLLGSPFSGTIREVPVSIEISDKPLRYTNAPKPDEAPKAEVQVVAYNPWLMTVGIVAVCLVIGLGAWLAARTALIRDTLMPQMRRSDRSFSLGRFQMLIWFAVILASFVFIYIITFDANSITTESFALLGISASTALAAVAIERSKSDPATDPIQIARKALESAGITTCEHADQLFHTAGNVKANTIIKGASLPANSDPTVQELRTEYENQIAGFRSAGFLQDLVNDVNGPTIHRWQILIWTIVLGLIYLAAVYSGLEVPAFGTNLLALMGISSGVYLGFKIPEKQT